MLINFYQIFTKAFRVFSTNLIINQWVKTKIKINICVNLIYKHCSILSDDVNNFNSQVDF
jgi:hypothetical protein